MDGINTNPSASSTQTTSTEQSTQTTSTEQSTQTTSTETTSTEKSTQTTSNQDQTILSTENISKNNDSDQRTTLENIKAVNTSVSDLFNQSLQSKSDAILNAIKINLSIDANDVYLNDTDSLLLMFKGFLSDTLAFNEIQTIEKNLNFRRDNKFKLEKNKRLSDKLYQQTTELIAISNKILTAQEKLAPIKSIYDYLLSSGEYIHNFSALEQEVIATQNTILELTELHDKLASDIQDTSSQIQSNKSSLDIIYQGFENILTFINKLKINFDKYANYTGEDDASKKKKQEQLNKIQDKILSNSHFEFFNNQLSQNKKNIKNTKTESNSTNTYTKFINELFTYVSKEEAKIFLEYIDNNEALNQVLNEKNLPLASDSKINFDQSLSVILSDLSSTTDYKTYKETENIDNFYHLLLQQRLHSEQDTNPIKDNNMNKLIQSFPSIMDKVTEMRMQQQKEEINLNNKRKV